MRCLGRLVSLVVLLLLLGAAWLYRDELRRRVQATVDPMSVARQSGALTPGAGPSAQKKLATLHGGGPDSVMLTPSEVGAFVIDGLHLRTAGLADSLQAELGDRSLRLSGLVSTTVLTDPVRSFVRLPLAQYEPVTLAGSLTPAGRGMAEWHLERVTLHGVPLPADLVGRLLREAGAPAADGRLQIPLPDGVTGFRVRPDGAAFYRGAVP